MVRAWMMVAVLWWAGGAGAETAMSEAGPLQVQTLVTGLEHPWSLAFLPDGAGLLVTERPGRLRLVSAQGTLRPAPVTGTPPVFAQGQGGLLDVVLSPDFARDRRVYLSWAAEVEPGRAATWVGHGRLSEDLQRLEALQVIFRQEPAESSGHHFGGRLVFDREGHLFITLGEHNQRITAQKLERLQGKVVRLHADGGIPRDNPFVDRAGARGEIWSYGHRNPQGAAMHPRTGILWVHEHGPRGGDELNIPAPGANHGWPLATHGINYNMLRIPESRGETVPGTVPPHHVWTPSPGLSGMAFYTSDRVPAWQDSLFIGAMAARELIRLQLDGDQVVHEERLLGERKARIRDVRQGPDGALYLLTDDAQGALWRVAPVRQR